MKKIGISTVFTGYNYGSALQAYATKLFLKELGYDGTVLSLKGSLVQGRDIRVKKVIVIMMRFLCHPFKMKKRMGVYKTSISQEYSELTKELFEQFRKEEIAPVLASWSNLKRMAKSEEYVAFLCGSDQIWNGDILYVDPQYYLRYAPKGKRIAFAPSFGRNKVADYNKKVIKKYISEIPFLSVREKSGQDIIKNLTGRDAVHLIDPTLMISGDEWMKQLNVKEEIKKDYILAYFLSEPSEKAKTFIKELNRKKKIPVIAIPYGCGKEDWYCKVESAGPREFLDLIKNAACVCTDSFHGTAFSINFHVPYYTFERNYGMAEKQSSRIQSLLKLVHQEERFNPMCEQEIDFKYSEIILEKERKKAKEYLMLALKKKEKIVNESKSAGY